MTLLLIGLALGGLIVEALHVGCRRSYHDRDVVHTLHTDPAYADARAAHPSTGVPPLHAVNGLAPVIQLRRQSTTDPAA